MPLAPLLASSRAQNFINSQLRAFVFSEIYFSVNYFYVYFSLKNLIKKKYFSIKEKFNLISRKIFS
jgi:hypothetical protein